MVRLPVMFPENCIFDFTRFIIPSLFVVLLHPLANTASPVLVPPKVAVTVEVETVPGFTVVGGTAVVEKLGKFQHAAVFLVMA